MFRLRLKYEKDGIDVKHTLIKNIGNGNYGQAIRKNFDYVYKWVTKIWIEENMIIELLNLGKSRNITLM